MNESNQSEMDWGYYIKAPEIGNQYLYFSCSLINYICMVFFFFSSRRRHTRFDCHWSSDVCSSDWQGTNHTPDNIYIHLPDHDTLMLVDLVLPGWVPFYDFNLSEDVPASIAAPAKALSYPWKHYIGGHMGRLGTRDDVVVHQQYVTDIADNVRTALATVDPTPYFTRYGNNAWAAVKTYLDAVAYYAAAPVIAKYTGVLAGADVFTASTAFI